MFEGHSERTARARVVRLGGREIIAEGLSLNFWADISHRCMTASWPALIVGAALVFLVFNAIFAFIYWIGFHGIGDQPISNVPGGAYIDYFYFSIELDRRLRRHAPAEPLRPFHRDHRAFHRHLLDVVDDRADLCALLAIQRAAVVRQQSGRFEP
jgi:hypothetical protein